MGEGKGVFNVASLKHGSARRPSPPTPVVRATLAIQYCFCNVRIINYMVWMFNIPFILMKTGNLEMMASSASSDTLRSFICFLDGFYEERGQLVA